MNHTHFPNEDHLPDWACRDNKVAKGDHVEGVHVQKSLGSTRLECSFEKELVLEWCVLYRMVQKPYTMSCSVFSMKISNVILSLCVDCSCVAKWDQGSGKEVWSLQKCVSDFWHFAMTVAYTKFWKLISSCSAGFHEWMGSNVSAPFPQIFLN